MARSLNKVQLIGNLGADPEIRSLPSGGRVAQFSVATSRQWNDQAGVKQEKTEWHRVVAWNSKSGRGLADLAEKYLKKGDKVYVEGSIEYRSYEDKKDGATKYITEIKAFEIILLGGKSGGTEGGEGMGRRSAAPATAGGQAKAREGSEFADYPEALDADDDDLPF